MSDLEGLWNEPGLESTSDRSSCPPRDELAELVAGRLDTTRREELVDHLVACGDCASEVQLLRRLSSWAERAEELVAADRGSESRSTTRNASRWAWPSAAAAAIAALVCAVGWQRALHAPAIGSFHPNVQVVDLLPAGALRAAPSATEVEIVAPKGEAPLVLVLDAASAAGDSFAVEIRRDGRDLARLERLVRTPFDNLTISLPASSLPPGRYELRLTSTTGAAEHTVGVYFFTLLGRP